MTTELAEMQFELLPSEDAAEGFTFGIGLDASINDNGFVPGGAEWLTQDSQNSRRGTNSFGRDVLTGPTWTWEAHVNRGRTTDALETLEEWSTSWRPEAARTPGDIIPLRYRVGNRTRRVYGRPRRFDAPPSNQIMNGFVPVTKDFKCVDALTYDDVAKEVDLSVNQSSGGGFILPATMPISTSAGETNGTDSTAVVGGTARTYPMVRFEGPWQNPGLICDAWHLRFTTTLLAGDYIDVDLRPWKLTAILNGEKSVAGLLGRRVWLEDIVFEPKSNYDLALTGFSATGGAACTVRWHDAFNSY